MPFLKSRIKFIFFNKLNKMENQDKNKIVSELETLSVISNNQKLDLKIPMYYKIIENKSQIDLIFFWNNSQNPKLVAKLLK